MKISNNALNFLLAQYRAIFKRAYVKGIASAVLLTAGLAAGQAQAVENVILGLADQLPPANQEVTITSKGYADAASAPKGEYSYIQIATSANKTDFDGTVTIESGSQWNYIRGVASDVKISGKGTLKIDVTETDITQPSLIITGSGGNVSFDINTVNVNRGALNVLNSSEASKSGTVALEANNISIGSDTAEDGSITAFLNLTSNATDETATLGRAEDDTEAGHTASTINVLAGGQLTMNSSGGSGAFIKGESFTVGNQGVFLVADGAKNTLASDFTYESGSMNVIEAGQDTGTLTFTGTTGQVQNGANVLVEAGAKWVLANTEAGGTAEAPIAPSVTFESGANVQIGGTLTISGGTLTVADGAGLNAVTEAGTSTSGSIVLTKSGSVNGTMTIGVDTLDSFLKADDHLAITKTAEKYGVAKEATQDDAGSLILNEGKLILTGTSEDTPFDLATELKFSGSSSDAGKAGYIVVNSSTGSSTIVGGSLAISNKLGDGDGAATELTSGSKLMIEANSLTLGKDNTASVGDYGFSGATTKNLTLLSDGTFNLVNDITLHATNRDVTVNDGSLVEVADDGKITGNLNISGATVTIDAGDYTTKNDITVSSGSLVISGTAAVTSGENQHEAWDASLTILNGGSFKIDKGAGASGDPEVKVTGAEGASALLDLTNISTSNVTWGSGSITVSGAATSGDGTLRITGTQFEKFLTTDGANGSKTKLSLDDHGVLFVEGSNTSYDAKINVNKFDTIAESGTVAFIGSGSFETDVPLTLFVDKDASADADKVLAIGEGTIKAPSITLSNNTKDAKDFTISGGTLQVANSLSSTNATVIFKDGASDSGSFLKLDGAGSVNVDTLFNGKNSALIVVAGDWTYSGKDAYFSGGADFTIGSGDNQASLTVDNLNFAGAAVGSESSGSVASGSELTVNTMQAGENSSFTVNGLMTINGRSGIVTTGENADIKVVADNAKTAGINLSGASFTVSGSEAQLTIGDTATSALFDFTTNEKDVVNKALDGATYKLDGFATLRLEFADNVTLTAAQAGQLKDELFKSTNGDVGDGIINVGDAKLKIDWEPNQDKVVKWDNVKEFAEIESVTSDELKQALVTDITGAVAGHYGAMQVKPDTVLMVDGRLGLHAARNGKFVFSESNDQTTVEGVNINAGSLLLAGAGEIGAIQANRHDVTIAKGELEGAAQGTTVVSGAVDNAATFKVGNNTTVAGTVTAATLDLADDTSLSNSTYDMTLGQATIHDGANLSTANLTLTGTNSTVAGTADVAETLTVQNGSLNIFDGAITAQDTVLANGVVLQVGRDDDPERDDPSTTDIDEGAGATGSFETQSLTLKGGVLVVDPEYGDATALASVKTFGAVSDEDFNKNSLVGTLDGSVFVGKNSALGIGTENKAELAQVIAKYQTNGSLSNAEDRLGAIVYLDGIATVSGGQSVIMTNKGLTEFVKYYDDNNGNQPNIVNANAPVIADTMFFGTGTALMVTADALNKVGAGTNPTALVTFEQDGKLVADGGEVLITGDLRGNRSYTLFADKGNDTKVDVVDIKGAEVNTKGEGIAVTTENGFLVGELLDSTGGVVKLGLAGDARARMSGASDPVYDTLVAYFNGYNGAKTTDPATGADTTDYLYKKLDPQTNQTTGEVTYIKDTNYSNYFLAGALAQGNGSAAEAAARMGVYGGAPQAAIKASQSSTDAIAARFGIGSAISNLTVAGNNQGAALWLAPVYKTSDSDGFDAQGVDYGVNVDLYGVALGADYTLANGISFGAMFNVGSGEVDGEGAASPVTNDFDYYGFGAYAGYTMGQFSVVGDISYTVADNEVEASTSVDHIGAQMDSTNLSLGVTGKYELSFNGVNVTPHVGLRYSNIDLDDYTIDGNDVIASADSDKLNLFSIPVGVTIAKEFKGESWTVAPSFDLTLTGQFGDDELDGSVSWAGISNLTTDTTTEVFDNFTYGATLGVEAQSIGGVALGLSVGYTGSSNVDEFGVNANARFTF